MLKSNEPNILKNALWDENCPLPYKLITHTNYFQREIIISNSINGGEVIHYALLNIMFFSSTRSPLANSIRVIRLLTLLDGRQNLGWDCIFWMVTCLMGYSFEWRQTFCFEMFRKQKMWQLTCTYISSRFL